MWQTSERYCNNKPMYPIIPFTTSTSLEPCNVSSCFINQSGHLASSSPLVCIGLTCLAHPGIPCAGVAIRPNIGAWVTVFHRSWRWAGSDEFLKMGNMPTGQQANRFLMVGHSSRYPGSYDNFADCLGDSFTSYTVLMSKSGGVMVSGQLSSWRIWIPLHKPWPNIAYLFEPLI